MNVYWVAAVWMAMALAASLISIRTGVAVALVEIVVGAVVGNLPGHAHLVFQTEFTSFLATLGSAVLTFLSVNVLSVLVTEVATQRNVGLGQLAEAQVGAGVVG